MSIENYPTKIIEVFRFDESIPGFGVSVPSSAPYGYDHIRHTGTASIARFSLLHLLAAINIKEDELCVLRFDDAVTPEERSEFKNNLAKILAEERLNKTGKQKGFAGFIS
jgi:hypothetical protein